MRLAAAAVSDYVSVLSVRLHVQRIHQDSILIQKIQSDGKLESKFTLKSLIRLIEIHFSETFHVVVDWSITLLRINLTVSYFESWLLISN